MSETEVGPKKTGVEKQPLDDAALEKLAVEELMREAVLGAARAEVVGPSGWVKAPQQKANKRFLANTLRNAVSSNKYRSSLSKDKQAKSSPQKDKRPEPTIQKDKSRRKH